MRSPDRHPVTRNWIPLTLAVVAVVLLIVHVGVAGYAVTHWRWSLPMLAALAGLVAAKLLLFTRVRTLRARRRAAALAPETEG
jgi:hypothetical protein